MKPSIHTETAAATFQIAPMIDVTFVIMLFFMVMAGTLKVERELSIQLPRSCDSAAHVTFPADEITIGIESDGTVTLNEEVFDTAQDKKLPALTRTLQRVAVSSARQQQKVLVTVQAEEQARYERIMDVLNSLHQAKIHNVTFLVGQEAL
ncbi:ExbD/TolR family protein [Prosthecobacter vanneervenii]|uniref:Biopolymer transport protein ExbD n=1 Tax=Prosthecobacter vanneervenii TaxID=48466 RepID=A0A7W7YEE4_9BACT|nr:biopolymer transporter ExbD [Prosthecobacter vanneervenii]MBB5034651.1 biopolymer transport protein ExbD [Prosthecobacter vanneervenii]